jgi:hypothetical protein
VENIGGSLFSRWAQNAVNLFIRPRQYFRSSTTTAQVVLFLVLIALIVLNTFLVLPYEISDELGKNPSLRTIPENFLRGVFTVAHVLTGIISPVAVAVLLWGIGARRTTSFPVVLGIVLAGEVVFRAVQLLDGVFITWVGTTDVGFSLEPVARLLALQPTNVFYVCLKYVSAALIWELVVVCAGLCVHAQLNVRQSLRHAISAVVLGPIGSIVVLQSFLLPVKGA